MWQVLIQEIQDDSLLLKLNFVLEHVTRVSLKPTNRRDHVTVEQGLLFFIFCYQLDKVIQIIWLQHQ